jgi:hypothetical protein
MMRKLRVAVALLTAVVGAALIVWIPVSRRQFARDRLDVDRAISPLVRLEDFRSKPQQTINVSLPTDNQWKRLVKRLGAPRLMILLENAHEGARPRTFGAVEAHVAATARADAQPVEMTVTSDLPWGWGSTSTRGATAYRFTIGDGQTLQLSISTKGTDSEAATLIVVPEWNSVEIWDIADGLAMAQGFMEVFTPAILASGCGLLFIAAMIGLAPFAPTR